jgi:hypothetical protein
MDKRHKQKLERDLERYRALLNLATDQRALAVLKRLIKETRIASTISIIVSS